MEENNKITEGSSEQILMSERAKEFIDSINSVNEKMGIQKIDTTNVKVVSVKPEVSFEELMKADIRICQIISVEKVKNADKLYVLNINTGFDERVVVSGIADKFTPEQLLNKKMPFVLNLPSRKIRGIESFGMIIMAEGSNGEFYDLPNENAEVGAVLI